MHYPVPSPQATAETGTELRRLYLRRSAIDRLIQALEGYKKNKAKIAARKTSVNEGGRAMSLKMCG